MDRVNGQDYVDIGGGRRGFRSQNKLAGVAGTEVTDTFLNNIQEEILKVIEAAGIVPSAADMTQLWQALNLMVLPGFAGRLAWMPVLSVTTTDPPGGAAIGDAYIVPDAAGGDWAGQAQKLAIWVGGSWALVATKDGHGVGLPDGRLFVRIGGIYVEYLATDVRAGLVKTATTQEVKDATGTGAVRAQDLVSYILRPDEDEITLYIRPDGDDINDGSANDAGHAFKTIAAAIDRIQNRYAFAGRKAILKLGTPGTYDTCIIRSVAGSLEIVGDKDNRADYVLTGARGMTISSAAVTLSGLTLTYGNGAIQHNLQVGNSGVATIDGVIFNCAVSQSTWSHIFSTDGGSVILQSGFSATIGGDAYAALYAATGGTIAASTAAEMLITPNNPTFSDATVVARSGGVVEIAALTFHPGGGIGRRYHAALNGVINTNGGGANFIPGNSAGLTETGGQYA
ncbi:DUF2793 domain-containing protein [Mesorhizobium sp. 1M-11]|uniref:DUF2793 domain-containing protein n=1 Tax=Mesorhizobium sp. 1M-11 TaxID=1529006 RepID=UPI0006C7668C|nr:DUF2793 domain-containing protein [Mesorhizobium sp. 1M-11]